MVQQNLLTIFIAVTALAVLIQTGILAGFYFVSSKLAEVRHGVPESGAKSFGIDQAVAESTLHSESKLRRSGRVIPS